MFNFFLQKIDHYEYLKEIMNVAGVVFAGGGGDDDDGEEDSDDDDDYNSVEEDDDDKHEEDDNFEHRLKIVLPNSYKFGQPKFSQGFSFSLLN